MNRQVGKITGDIQFKESSNHSVLRYESLPKRVGFHSAMSILFFLLLAGCAQTSSPDWQKFNSSVNGRTFVYSSNSNFSVELTVDADAGRRWDYTISDPTILRIDSTSYRPASGNWNQVGDETIETFYFTTLRPGSVAVLMIQHRPWAPATPPVDTLTFTVFVHL